MRARVGRGFGSVCALFDGVVGEGEDVACDGHVLGVGEGVDRA